MPTTVTSTTSVDPAALRAAAQRLEIAADTVLDAVGSHLRGLRFDGTVAGRAHTGSGWALRAAMDALAGDAARWSRAAADLAAALRAGADRHAGREANAATVFL